MDAFDSRRADELATLLALHEQGSFAAAGRQLERHPTVLSKRLSALEVRLGIRLVERSTRQLRFTDEGERLVAKVREASRLIAEAEQEAAEGAATVRGRLRLALPAAMGRRWLSGMLADFVLAYPQVMVEAEYADRFVDLIGEGFDAAIRIGELADNRLVARKLCDHLRILCASPEYLARHGVPRTPEELLARHRLVGYFGSATEATWPLRLARQGVVHHTSQFHLYANDSAGQIAMLVHGLGVGQTHARVVQPLLAAGALTPVLQDWTRQQVPLSVLYPPTRHLNQRARVFVDWLTRVLKPRKA